MSEPLTDEELGALVRDLIQSGNQKQSNHLSNDIEERAIEVVRELRAHRAWRAKLGDPDTWFSRLTFDGCVFTLPIEVLISEARALVERAKEET
jgi:hypothetical protein